MNRADVVIVGGGLAGAVTAAEYRKAGGTGSLAIISQDLDFPVHRPPLSKEYLRGEQSRDEVYVHPPRFYEEQDIAVQLDTRVEALDLAERRVELVDGRRVTFGTLVLATGARPRKPPIPGGSLPGVFFLRSLASADRLRQAYEGARRAVVVGAGFVGMEVAAALTQRGVECTVVEMGPRMWPSLVPAHVASFIQGRFEQRGVTFLFDRAVTSFQGDGHVRTVILDDGRTLPADLVVVGAGAELNTELAEGAGLAVDRGIVVDDLLRTSNPAVYAAGDVASFPDPVAGRLHLEHWDNALQQGRALGRTLAGQPAAFDHVAYFFSDLFDLSLNMVGYPAGWDEVAVLGDPAGGRFTTVYLKGGVVRAALMLNDDSRSDTWTEMVRERRPFEAEPSLAGLSHTGA